MLFTLRARDGSLYYLLNDKGYSVGRKECDILINNDQSISRKHALLSVKTDKLILTDCGSRYNTFINDTKLEANVEVILKSGDVIKFGMLQSIFIFEQVNIVTTTSSIKSSQKVQLKNNINFLRGSLVQNWNSQCTHVTVEEIMLSVKVLCAIISGIPIVNLKYWDDYVQQVQQNLPPPDVTEYRPACSEMILNKTISLDFKIERQSIFKNKLFVFPTKSDEDKMVNMIKLAGGKAISWDRTPITKEDLNVATIEYIMVQTSELIDNKLDASLLEFIGYINRLGKRTIPLPEIALAIVNCSCDKDCNPDFDRKGTVLAVRSQNDTLKRSGNILVQETQTQPLIIMDTQSVKMEYIVPQSGEHDVYVSPPNITIDESPPKEVESSQKEVEANVKREGEPVEGLFAAKRMKMEQTPLFTKGKPKRDVKGSPELNSESPKESQRHYGKALFAFDNDNSSKKNVSPDSAKLVINPFAKKRKALQSDDPDDENPPKKLFPAVETCLPNMPPPFTSKVGISSNINPFANILNSKNSKVSQVLATSKTKKSTSTMLSSTVINENVSSLQIDLSQIEAVDSRLEKSDGWISKTACSNRTVDKYPSKMENGLEEGVDEEIMKYIESFKNTVVIVEEEALVVRKSGIINQNGSSIDTSNGRNKNFKKFIKIQPLRIQTTIIPESKYVNIICNEKCAIQLVPEESESEDDNHGMGMGTQKETRKRGGKRYLF